MNNLPSLDILYINQLCINDFRCTVTDIVHSLSRLSARSALLPAAEVSTGDPRPTAFDFPLWAVRSHLPFRQVFLPTERTSPLPARRCRQGKRSAYSLSADWYNGFCGAAWCTANAAVSPVGSVGASACGRGLHRRPAPPNTDFNLRLFG